MALLGTGVSFGEAIPRDSGARPLLSRLQVPFVENRGQVDSRVAFSAQMLSGSVFVTREGNLVYSFSGPSIGRTAGSGWSVTETLVGGHVAVVAGVPAKTGVNYFLGKDPRFWRRNVPTCDEIGLGEVWRGVSVSIRAHGGHVEKIFTVSAGVGVENIRLRLDGAGTLRLDSDGALVAAADEGEIRLSPPVAYQEWGGVRRWIVAAYVPRENTYGFRLGRHKRSLPVVIDPLVQATYLGGSDFDRINAIAVHPTTSEILVVGHTASSNFPGTAGGAQAAFVGPAPGYDAFVARLDPTLHVLLQATYLGGGGSGTLDVAQSIAVDPVTGNVLIGGQTSSTDFPGTSGGAQPTYGGGGDGFIACLNPTLTTLLAATYVGGNSTYEFVGAIAVHPTTNDLIVVGETDSANFPGTAGGAQPANAGGGGDLFVARFNSSLSSLLQATYLGGSGYEDLGIDDFTAIAVDPATGDIFVGGITGSADLPATAGGAQATKAGGLDGFVARLDSTLTRLKQATYLGGGRDDDVTVLALHPTTGEVVVAGGTQSTDLPGTAGGALPAYPGGALDLYVAILDSTLQTLRRTTYFGGTTSEEVDTIAVHPATGDIFIAGLTQSRDIPGVTGGVQTANAGGFDAFVSRFNASLTTLEQATYLGGTADDGAHGIAINPATGDLLVAGGTSSMDFPGSIGGAQPSASGSVNGFVALLTPDLASGAPSDRLPVFRAGPRPPLRTIIRTP